MPALLRDCVTHETAMRRVLNRRNLCEGGRGPCNWQETPPTALPQQTAALLYSCCFTFPDYAPVQAYSAIFIYFAGATARG